MGAICSFGICRAAGGFDALWLSDFGCADLGDHHILCAEYLVFGFGRRRPGGLLCQVDRDRRLGSRESVVVAGVISRSVSWALGSCLFEIWPIGRIVCATGWQVVFAGIANLIYAFVNKEFFHVDLDTTWRRRDCIPCSIGSLVGYTAYIWVLDNAPAANCSTMRM